MKKSGPYYVAQILIIRSTCVRVSGNTFPKIKNRYVIDFKYVCYVKIGHSKKSIFIIFLLRVTVNVRIFAFVMGYTRKHLVLPAV